MEYVAQFAVNQAVSGCGQPDGSAVYHIWLPAPTPFHFTRAPHGVNLCRRNIFGQSFPFAPDGRTPRE